MGCRFGLSGCTGCVAPPGAHPSLLLLALPPPPSFPFRSFLRPAHNTFALVHLQWHRGPCCYAKLAMFGELSALRNRPETCPDLAGRSTSFVETSLTLFERSQMWPKPTRARFKPARLRQKAITLGQQQPKRVREQVQSFSTPSRTSKVSRSRSKPQRIRSSPGQEWRDSIKVNFLWTNSRFGSTHFG